jgi:hypothetical protein
VPFDCDDALRLRNLPGTRPGFSASPDPEFPEDPSLQPGSGDPAVRALFELSATAIDLSGILDWGGASARKGRG